MFMPKGESFVFMCPLPCSALCLHFFSLNKNESLTAHWNVLNACVFSVLLHSI